MGPDRHPGLHAEIGLNGGWDAVHHIVDVGGGTGALLVALLQRLPGVHGTLVELPATAERAAETFERAGLGERTTVCAQSFSDPLPAGADLYLLWKVLNDWPEAETEAILGRCAQAIGPHGRIVINGGVSGDEAPRRLAVDMLIAGGSTAPIGSFRVLAGRCGLEVVAAAAQEAGFVVECRAASA